MFAAQHGHNEIVRVLMQVGADHNVTGKHGHSAITLAEQYDDREATLALLRGE